MTAGNTVKDGSGSTYWLLIDSDGRLQITGSAAEDAAAAGNPLLAGGRYDATPRTLDDGDAGALALDAAGRQGVVGAAAENAAAAGNPLLAGGRYDAADRTLNDADVGGLALDVAGRTKVVGAAAEDANVVGNPVLVAGRYDSAARTLETTDVGTIAVDVAGRTIVSQYNETGHSIIQLTADGNIKASAGTLYSLVVTGAGVTAGDSVTIKDGGAGGTARLTVVLAATNEVQTVNLRAAAFTTSIYSDETKAGGGTIYVSAVFD